MEIEWREPWELVADGEQRRHLEAELRRELTPSHPLHGRTAKAVAHRIDQDDVLFLVDEELAVVHLTYSSSVPECPPWPRTRRFSSPLEFVSKCLTPDHDDYTHLHAVPAGARPGRRPPSNAS